MGRVRRPPRPPLPRLAVAWFPLTPLQVQTHVQRVVAAWPPIPLAFRAVRTEANEFLFLMAGRGAASVAALHDKLYTRSLRQHLRPEFAYAPHITLARYAALEPLQAAREEAEDLFREEMNDVMRAVTLLAVARDGRIAPLATFPLNSS